MIGELPDLEKLAGLVGDVGVIVGRFQVPSLHDGHIELLEKVCQKHRKVIVFLGMSHTKGARNNPLDWESRKQMIIERFPAINVLYIKDCNDDFVWSMHLDEAINDLVSPGQSVILYGSRDSFLKHYKGKRQTEELKASRIISGSEIRKDISRSVMNTHAFRCGVIWAMHNQYDKVFPTVDIAILNDTGTEMLLGRKPTETKFRFIGGFSDVKSPTYEADARREVAEETGIEITDPVYIGSTLIDDWRYRGEKDKIKTLFFVATHMYGQVGADDDIAEVRWFKLANVNKGDMVETHWPLYDMLKAYLKKQEGIDHCLLKI